jgi:hypothetical protein
VTQPTPFEIGNRSAAPMTFFSSVDFIRGCQGGPGFDCDEWLHDLALCSSGHSKGLSKAHTRHKKQHVAVMQTGARREHDRALVVRDESITVLWKLWTSHVPVCGLNAGASDRIRQQPTTALFSSLPTLDSRR